MHEISEAYRQRMLNDIKKGKNTDDPVEDLFLTGVVNLEKISRAKGEKTVSVRTTDDYFLGTHNRFSECKAYIGTVESSRGKNALVRIGEETREYENIFGSSIKPGNKVILHGKYVVKKA